MKWLIPILLFSWAASAAPVTSPLPSPAPNNSPLPPTPIATVSPTSIPISSPIPNSPSPSPSASPSPSTSSSPSPSGTPNPNDGPRITGGKKVCWQKDKLIEQQEVNSVTFVIQGSKTQTTNVAYELSIDSGLTSRDADDLDFIKSYLTVTCNGSPIKTQNQMEIPPGGSATINCTFSGKIEQLQRLDLFVFGTNGSPVGLNAQRFQDRVFSAEKKEVCCSSQPVRCGSDEILGTQCGCSTCLCKNGLPKVNGRCPCEGNWAFQEVDVLGHFVVGGKREEGGVQRPNARFLKSDHMIQPRLQFCIGALMPATATFAELDQLERNIIRGKPVWDEAWTKIYKAPAGGRDIVVSSEVKISRLAVPPRNVPRYGECSVMPGFHYIRVTNETFTRVELETGKTVADCRSFSSHWKLCKGMENLFSATFTHEVGHVMGQPDAYAEGNREQYLECGQPVRNNIMETPQTCWPNCELPLGLKRIPFDLACGGPCPDVTTNDAIQCAKCGDVNQMACRGPGAIQRSRENPDGVYRPGEKCECIPYPRSF